MAAVVNTGHFVNDTRVMGDVCEYQWKVLVVLNGNPPRLSNLKGVFMNLRYCPRSGTPLREIGILSITRDELRDQ